MKIAFYGNKKKSIFNHFLKGFQLLEIVTDLRGRGGRESVDWEGMG